MHYFQLIEECVSQIVLHKNGVDPDFRGRFTLQVEPLLEGMANKEQVCVCVCVCVCVYVCVCVCVFCVCVCVYIYIVFVGL